MARCMAHHTLVSQDPKGFLAERNPHGRPWHEIPDDGLLYDHLAELLLHAGRENDLDALFHDDQWMRARSEQSGRTYEGFLHDLKLAWEGSALPRTAYDPHAFAQCARYALIRAAVYTRCHGEAHSQPASHETAPHGAQPVLAGPSPDALSDFAPRLVVSYKEDAFNRAYRAALASETGSATWRRALNAAANIDTDSGRANALALLGSHLPSDQAPRALQSALKIENAYHRARAVGALTPHLTGPARSRALAQALTISSLNRMALRSSAIWQTLVSPAVRALEPAFELPRRLIRWLWIFHLGIADPKVRRAARACLTPGQRGQAAREAVVNVNDLQLLKALIPHLSAGLLARTLEKVIAHRCEDGKARAIPWFGPHVDPDQLARCLDGALGLAYEADRARALIGLAPYIPSELHVRALSGARAVTDDRLRALALLALHPHSAGESAALLVEIREAAAFWLLHEDSRTFDEVVLLCFDDSLLRPPILNRKTLLGIHRSIEDISRRWRWL